MADAPTPPDPHAPLEPGAPAGASPGRQRQPGGAPRNGGGAQNTIAPSDRQVEKNAARAAARNVGRIAELVRQQRYSATRSERISGAIARFAGTLGFVGLHLLAFVTWIAWNALGPRDVRFDPFPFGILTLIVSMEGVLVATFVLVAQNRMTAEQERRDHLQLQINILAEQETTMVIRMLQHLITHLNVPHAPENFDELAHDTDLDVLLHEIDRQVPLE